MYRSELTIQPCGIMSTNIASSASKKPWLWLSLLKD